MSNEIERLSFWTLQQANRARLPQFKDKHGNICHSKPDGSDWTPAQWLQAMIGELGEYANVRKKFERGDLTFGEYEVLAEKELADVQTYFSILCLRALDDGTMAHPDGVDLGQAVTDKFNEVSERVGSTVRIQGNRWFHVDVDPTKEQPRG